MTTRSAFRLASLPFHLTNLALLGALLLPTTPAAAHFDGCPGGVACGVGEYRVTLDAIRILKFPGSVLPPDSNPDIVIKTNVQAQTHGSQTAVFGEYEDHKVGNTIPIGRLIYWHADCTPGERLQVTIDVYDLDGGPGEVVEVLLQAGGGIVAAEFPALGPAANAAAKALGKAIGDELNTHEQFPQWWSGNLGGGPFWFNPNAGTRKLFFRNARIQTHSYEAWLTFQYIPHDIPCNLANVAQFEAAKQATDSEVGGLFRRIADDDGDGVPNQVERVFGSDPRDRNSKPENALYTISDASLCDDGIDNDLDGFVDAEDGSCNASDNDFDGIPDDTDNCIDVSNPDQANSDADGLGDACDDDDNDPPLSDLDETYEEHAALYDLRFTDLAIENGSFGAIGDSGEIAGRWNDRPAIDFAGDLVRLETLGDSGQITAIGGRGWSAGHYLLGGRARPFVRPAHGPMLPLPTLGAVDGIVYAMDASNRWIAGETPRDNTEGAPRAPVVWEIFDEGGEVFAQVTALPLPGGDWGFARGVNSQGDVLGTAQAGDGTVRVVLWRYLDGEYELVDLGQGFAWQLAETGVAVGSLRNDAGRNQGFARTELGTRFLPFPADCEDCESFANDVNAHGQVIGFVNQPERPTRVVLWNLASIDEGPVDLSLELPIEYRELFQLTSALAINDAGQILVSGELYVPEQNREIFRQAVLTPTATTIVDFDHNGIVDRAEPDRVPFLRGDINGDANIDLADPIELLSALFVGDEPPSCSDSADANDDDVVDLSDSVHMLSHLFLGTRPIAQPTGDCGYDPTPDELGCEFSSVCDATTATLADPGALASKTLLSRRAQWECRSGFWANVEYADYACPDGSIVTVTVDIHRTDDPCGSVEAWTR